MFLLGSGVFGAGVIVREVYGFGEFCFYILGFGGLVVVSFYWVRRVVGIGGG